MNKLERLLDEALQTTTFAVSGSEDSYGTNEIRTLHAQGTLQEYSGLAPIVPDPLRARLVDEMELLLRGYVNPETRCVGHGLIDVLGGRIDPPLELFVDDVVCAAAALGSGQVLKLLSEWSDGKPALYEMRTVLFGGKIERTIELRREGIRIDVMPASFDELSSEAPSVLRYMEPPLSSDSVLGRPVLSVACSGGPVFHMPTGGMDGGFHQEWAHGTLPEFSLDAFCKALSLAGNGCIQPKYEWPHAPDLRLFVSAPEGLAHPKGVFDTSTSVSLTQRHLEDARDLFLMRNGLPAKTRRSLNVAIHRWINSKRESSTEAKLIELRIALEALYLRDVDGEMSYRLATRGAWHLGGSLEKRKTIFSILRSAYSLASKVVHARETRIAEKTRILEDGQDACRKGILMVLKQGEPNWNELTLGTE